MPAGNVKKSDFRRFFQNQLGGMSAELRQHKQKLFQQNINAFLTGKTGVWGAYRSLPEEMCLDEVIKQHPHLDWVFPKVEKWGMIFYRGARFVRSSYGILEPEKGADRVDWKEFNGLFVPGLGFNRRGVRLGRGKAYYDRFLGELQRQQEGAIQAIKVGVGFLEQIVEAEIPLEPHDVMMDFIISDGGIWRI